MPRPKRKLPLDDPRWQPLEEAHRQLTLRTGHPGLGATDLDKLLENNLLGCMRRQIAFGERELVPLEHWGLASSGGIYLLSTDKEGRLEVLDNMFKPVRHSVFYVWGPDFERWMGAESHVEDGVLARNKSGKKPINNWKLHVAAELLRAVAAGEDKPTGAKLAEFCEGKTGYQPEVSEVYKLVRALLHLL